MSWLLLLVLPIAAASGILVDRIDNRLTERVYAGLENSHRLEHARIKASLSQYAVHARNLATDSYLRLQLNRYSRVTRYNRSENDSTVSKADVSAVLNIQQRLRAISRNLKRNDPRTLEVKVVTYDGKFSGKTNGFTDHSTDSDLIAKARDMSAVAFSNAFINADGEALFGVAVPVFTAVASGSEEQNTGPRVTGFIITQMKLGPIVDLVHAHKKLGDTSESHIAQLTEKGDAQFITSLRFKQDAAFNLIVPKEKNVPINWSFDEKETRVLRSPDYRNHDSILAIGTIGATGWGLVVKIDAAEAFAALIEVKRLILFGAIVSIAGFLLSWWYMLRPLAHRICEVANAADRVAAGDYGCTLKDCVNDEIGSLSNSIDVLAQELHLDQKLRVEAERKLQYQAAHDSLTGLYNRMYMQDAIDELARQQSGEQLHSILFLDLDGFKAINDQHGHHIGDEILVAIADELSRILPADCWFGRWGGDEFLVVLREACETLASQVSVKISGRFEQAFDTSAGEQYLGCSIGISTCDVDTPLPACIELADSRMYRAKNARQSNNRERNSAISLVRESLNENRVCVGYRPLVEAAPGGQTKLIGAEAAIHLYDANGELVSCENFLPQIEEDEINSMLDREVLSNVLTDIQQWRQCGFISDDFCVTVNLSGPTIRHHCFAKNLLQKLESYDLPANSIALEIAVDTKDIDLDIIHTLRSDGFGLSVDNMTLHTLNMLGLAELYPDTVKFKGADSLCESATETTADTLKQKEILFKHFLNTCSDLNIKCVAENIETQHQMQRLMALGVNLFQGPTFSRFAETHDEFTVRLKGTLPNNYVDSYGPFRLAG